MDRIKWNNIGIGLKAKAFFIGRSDVLHNLPKINYIVFAIDMSEKEKRKFLNMLGKGFKILITQKTKMELGRIFGKKEVAVFGIKKGFEKLLIEKEGQQ